MGKYIMQSQEWQLIKQAKTKEEAERCFDYLDSKGLNPLIGGLFFYAEREGKITACQEVIYVAMFEPFACDNSSDGLRVSEQAIGHVRRDLNLIGGILSQDNIPKMGSIYKKLDFALWSENSNIYLKEI
jgi:hypothetical protein